MLETQLYPLYKYFSSHVDESITLTNFLDEQINYIFA